MSNALQRRYLPRPGVRYVDLGSAVDLSDPGLAFDGMHLTPAGNRIIAQHLIDSVRSAVANGS
jgi:lysophospholipase L1-like esterase